MSLRLVHRPKSPHWIIRGTVRRVRVEESSGTSDKRIAEEIRAKREAQILAESVYGRRATATFAAAALSYLEAGGNKKFLEPVIKHFGTIPLAKIDQDAIDHGARKLYPLVSPSTRNRQFYTPTSAVLKHAAKRGWCSAMILERPRTPPSRFRWLTLEEANRLIEFSGDHLRPSGHVSALHRCASWRSLVARLAQRRSHPQPCDFRQHQERRVARRAPKPTRTACFGQSSASRRQSISSPGRPSI